MNETPVEYYWIAPAIQWALFLLVALVGFRSTRAGRAAFWVLLLFVGANVADYAQEAGPRWETVTRHSDTPDQVIQGIQGLRAEATGRVSSLRRIRFRALAKSEEATKDGTLDSATREARADEWYRTWQEASIALSTISGDANASDRPQP